MKKIILVSGHAQNGKDTAAGFIKKALEEKGNKVLIAHYADLLKWMCSHFFGWDGKKDDKGRTILQHVGTDVIRKERPDYWVAWMCDFLDLFGNDWDYVLIPDTRFPNEVDYVKDHFGQDNTIHLRVNRPNFDSGLSEEQKNHPSETALDNTEPDFWLENNGGLEQYEGLAREFIENNL